MKIFQWQKRLITSLCLYIISRYNSHVIQLIFFLKRISFASHQLKSISTQHISQYRFLRTKKRDYNVFDFTYFNYMFNQNPFVESTLQRKLDIDETLTTIINKGRKLIHAV